MSLSQIIILSILLGIIAFIIINIIDEYVEDKNNLKKENMLLRKANRKVKEELKKRLFLEEIKNFKKI